MIASRNVSRLFYEGQVHFDRVLILVHTRCHRLKVPRRKQCLRNFLSNAEIALMQKIIPRDSSPIKNDMVALESPFYPSWSSQDPEIASVDQRNNGTTALVPVFVSTKASM